MGTVENLVLAGTPLLTCTGQSAHEQM